MLFGYCRVSTNQQNCERQISAIKKFGVNERFIFTDIASGKSIERKSFLEMLSFLKKGDTVVVKEIDRLGRNRKEIKNIILDFIEKDIELICLDMPYFKELILEKIKNSEGFLEVMANALLDVILEIAEQERKKILNRTKEGREKAKSKGIIFGRPGKISLEKFTFYYKKYMTRDMKACEIQKELKISKQTFYNYIKKMKVEK
ncbi:Site-specific DNA recombinase [Cetobacterium ceti]|uniref:Site-specific DNA recombinase n=1 Tax=Cetobacterium ceti TaxID=180163 RepID=A0A1T4QQL4_9FUSO|nr:recombinase family protein [Cetobacterium ceti]SKA05558.1 Site-specific DNA recombinase [Cetobacterium ceti]